MLNKLKLKKNMIAQKETHMLHSVPPTHSLYIFLNVSVDIIIFKFIKITKKTNTKIFFTSHLNL